MKKKLTIIHVLYAFMLIVPFWYGLFYQYTAYIAGAILLTILAIILIQKKKFTFSKSINFYIYSFIILSYLIVIFWSIDKNQAWEGFLKFLPSLVFFVILMQLEKNQRKGLLTSIPYSGITMCLISYLMQFIPSIKPLLYSENGRLVGFFQYSNTFALYLLIGIIILWSIPQKKVWHYIGMAVLLSGIILSGGRIVFILLVIFALYKIISQRKQKKKILIIASIAIATIAIIVLFLQLTGNMYIITRLFSISLKESTLLGRFLYNIDGLKILLAHPFGLGYGGYEWVYPSIQTAQYQVKYVHNDILQQGIDTGFITMGMLVFLIIRSIFNKKTSILFKEILSILFIHLFFDFDLQFVVMHFILVLAIFEEGTSKKEIAFNSKIIPALVFTSLFVTFSYFGVGYMALQKGNLSLAENMLSSNTNVKEAKLQEYTNVKRANQIADEIIKQNLYVVQAYNIKAINALEEEKWEDMLKYQKQAILLNQYEIKEYEQYVLLISQALDKTIKQNKQEQTSELIKALLEVKQLLEDVKQKTNPLAYEIKDKPNFELSDEIKDYLLKVEKQLQ